MKNIYFLLICLIISLLVSCSCEPEYKDVEPLTTKVNTVQTDGYSDTRNAYFGDLHVHTSWSSAPPEYLSIKRYAQNLHRN